MQMDDVCLAELFGARDVDATIGRVHLPKSGAEVLPSSLAEDNVRQDEDAFQKLRKLIPHLDDRPVAFLLGKGHIAHHHLCLHTVSLVEGIHEASRCNGTAATSFAGTD